MESKRDYEDRTKTKLEELRAKSGLVKEKSDKMKKSQTEYAAVFQALWDKLERAEENFQELERASEETWQDFKPKVEGALSDLNNAVGNVLARMG